MPSQRLCSSPPESHRAALKLAENLAYFITEAISVGRNFSQLSLGDVASQVKFNPQQSTGQTQFYHKSWGVYAATMAGASMTMAATMTATQRPNKHRRGEDQGVQDGTRNDIITEIEDRYGELGWEHGADDWHASLSLDALKAELLRAERETERRLHKRAMKEQERAHKEEMEHLAAQMAESSLDNTSYAYDPDSEEEDEYTDWTPERPPHEWTRDGLASYLNRECGPPPTMVRVVRVYQHWSKAKPILVAEFAHPDGGVVETEILWNLAKFVDEYKTKVAEAVNAYRQAPAGYTGFGRYEGRAL